MVIIIGAGPAGLAVAHELRRRGIPYEVLERGSIGNTWLHHYDRLHLHTLKQVSALPGLAMPASYPAFPAAHQFQAYLRDYAEHFQLKITCGVEVQDARWDGEGWQLATNHGSIPAALVLAATGIWSTPVCPTFDGQAEFGGTVIHSSCYRNALPFVGQRVLVVGSGNSGSEIAVDLSEHGVLTSIAIRQGVTFVPRPTSPTAMRAIAWVLRHAPTTLSEWLLSYVRRDYSDIGIPLPSEPLHLSYPVVGFGLPDAVAAGRIARYVGLACFTPDGVQFVDGSTATFDSIILATGYQPTLQFLWNEIELNSYGRPSVDKQWRSTRNPQLFCVGFWYPATEGWLQAIGRVAHQAADGIAATMAASQESFSASAV